MSRYLGNSRERLFSLNTIENAAALAGGGALPPHIVVSPRTARGLPTAGIALVLLSIPPPNGANYGTPAEADAPGFIVTLYRAIPTTPGYFAELQAYEGANYGDQLTLPDISGGMALFVGITNVGTQGNMIVGVAELD